VRPQRPLKSNPHRGASSRRARELGQNFLRDPNILEVIGRESELSERDVVLEVGGGEGVLSAYLAPRVAWVHVVELDERLREALGRSVGEYENVRLWWGDAMRVDFSAMEPAPTKMVANLPYGIAATVLLRTIEELGGIGMWLVMVQREVGERLAAPPGGRLYGVSSVLAQLAGEVKVVRAVPRGVFRPVPNVDSVLVKIVRPRAGSCLGEDKILRPRAGSGVGENVGVAQDGISPGVRRLVNGAFAHRRKALARSLQLAGVVPAREQVRDALQELGHPVDVRAERLAPAEFVALAEALGLC
jgi:16S rRNA (adenine1518-N6/adenine1519-N6)-dimethyltransferase